METTTRAQPNSEGLNAASRRVDLMQTKTRAQPNSEGLNAAIRRVDLMQTKTIAQPDKTDLPPVSDGEQHQDLNL